MAWLPPGQQIYVVGVPRWEGGHGTLGYRDATVVPVFRATGEHKSWLVDLPEQEATTRARWSIIEGVTWGLICALIALAQLFSLA